MLEQLLLAYLRYSPIRRGKYRLVEKFGRGTGGEQGFLRQARLKYGGYRMECDLRKMLQRQFYFFGTYFLEEDVLAQWCQQAKTASVVLDVGANAGIFSFAAAASNPLAKIHAFEPTPEIAAHFRRTIALNQLSDRVVFHQVAVARACGTAQLNFFNGEFQDNEGMNFITAESKSATSVAVPVVSLDDFCLEHGLSVIDLVKIDVQGNEPEVLAGAEGLLRRKSIKAIFLELNWDHADLAHCPASKAVRILEQAGYEFADPKLPMQFRHAGPWLQVLSDVVVRGG